MQFRHFVRLEILRVWRTLSATVIANLSLAWKGHVGLHDLNWYAEAGAPGAQWAVSFRVRFLQDKLT